MAGIQTLDLETFVTNEISDVFNKMLAMEVEIPVPDSDVTSDTNRIVGSVGLAGKVTGNICVHVSHTLARLMTSAMVGIELDEIEGEEDVHDVIGEFSNMIGGDLKSHFNDSGLPCKLSIPSITSGSDFEIGSMGWTRHERFAFRHQGHTALVEVFIKPGN